MAYGGVDDLRLLMPDLLDSEIESSYFGSYTQEAFYDELAAQSQYRADPEVLDTVVTESFDTLCWVTRQGVRFMPIYGRQAFKIDGRYTFWGGLTVEVSATVRRALPIAADDQDAKLLVTKLLDEIGFDTVDGGGLEESWRFERAKPAYCIPLNKDELKVALAAAQREVELPDGSWRP